jgi:hypothetical protein
MFSINFIEKPSPIQAKNTQLGKIVIGEFSELFYSSLSYWNQQQYLNQWKEGIHRICMGDPKSAVITDMYDPNSSNIAQWWVLRCEGDRVYVRNELLFLENVQETFAETEIYQYIEERPLVSQKGQKISQWETNLSDLQDFYSSILNK